MKIVITYELNADKEFPCCAGFSLKTEKGFQDYFAIGKTWAHAKENLLKKISAIRTAGTPPPSEEIELP